MQNQPQISAMHNTIIRLKTIKSDAFFKGNLITIEIQDPQCIYITINDDVYYIDNTTGEHFMDHWKGDHNVK